MNFYLGKYFISDGTKPIHLKVSAPIEWIPLESSGEETLVISKYVLDWELFGFDGEVTGWEDSYLKKYMDRLYMECFTEEEKTAILEKPNGRLFVLSKEEVRKYMPEQIDRRAQILFVTKKEDVVDIFMEHSTYWLRNETVSDCEEVANIDALGCLEYNHAECEEIGIRPCMYVSTSKVEILTAKTGYNKWHHGWGVEEL